MYTKNWLRLLSKLILLSGLIFVSFVFFRYQFIQGMRDVNFMVGIDDKHNNLKKMHSPRLILLGGSSVLFGFNSDTLQRHIGLSVMNMAMTAPLGLEFILDDIMPDLRPNDTVILSPEYEINTIGDVEYLLWASDFYPKAGKYLILPNTWQEKLKAYLLHQIKIFRDVIRFSSSENNFVYYRTAISLKGDIQIPKNSKLKQFNMNFGKKADGVNYAEHIEMMNAFAQKCQAKGVKVLYIYPNIAQSTYKSGEEAIYSVEKQLNERLKVKILGKPTDFVYADSLFFDSYNHLLPRGRDIRTKQLIELLKSNGVGSNVN